MVEGSRMFSSETRVASDQQRTTEVFNHELGGFPNPAPQQRECAVSPYPNGCLKK